MEVPDEYRQKFSVRSFWKKELERMGRVDAAGKQSTVLDASLPIVSGVARTGFKPRWGGLAPRDYENTIKVLG